MINKDELFIAIEDETENSRFDFKSDVYDFSNAKKKADFLVDILSMANGHDPSDKFIITGVKLFPGGDRELIGITLEKALNGADYQTLISENIEPPLEIETSIVSYENRKFMIHRIPSNAVDRPYILKKSFDKLPKGLIKIRRGERNDVITRRDLDLIHKRKLQEKESILKIEVNRHGKVLDLDSQSLLSLQQLTYMNEIKDLVNSINKVSTKSISSESLISGIFVSSALSTEVSIPDEEKEILRFYLDGYGIELSDSFFDLGNLRKSTIHDGAINGNNLLGTDEEENKYKLIKQLTNKVMLMISKEIFLDDLSKLNYIELCLSNEGSLKDENLIINLKIPEDSFVSVNQFPYPSKLQSAGLNMDDLVEDLFCPRPTLEIAESNYSRGMIPMEPDVGIFPLINNSYSGEGYFYSLVEYYFTFQEIEKRDGYIWLRLEIPEINPDTSVFLPSRIFLSKPIDQIEYSISSSNASKKVHGTTLYELKTTPCNEDMKFSNA